MGLLDHRALVGALHQLVDLRGHRVLDDLEQDLGVDVGVAVLGAADVQRAEAALIVRGDGDGVEDALDLILGEAVAQQPLVRAPLHERLRARARGDALGADADQPPRAALGSDGGAEQRVDLLRLDPGDRRRLVLRIARLDVHLGGARALALAHPLGDVRGQRLGAERALVQHDPPDRIVDDFLEAAHMRALLARTEVDEAVEAGGVQLLGPICADPDDLLHVRDAHARERERQLRSLALDVLKRQSHDIKARDWTKGPSFCQGQTAYPVLQT